MRPQMQACESSRVSFAAVSSKSPTWDGLRPTSDRLRETLFNILGPSVRGARVLDGYAGTGAIGIEALSRGAAEVTFVEQDPRAVKLIEANLAALGATRLLSSAQDWRMRSRGSAGRYSI